MTAFQLSIAILANPLAPLTATPYRQASFTVGPNIQVSVDRPDAVHVEAVIAAHPTDPNRLVAASMLIQRPHIDGWQDTWTVVVFNSDDGGLTWVRRQLPELPTDDLAGDPWLAWSVGGTVFLSCLAVWTDDTGREVTSTWIYRSADNGTTWSPPFKRVFPPGTSQDHPVMTAGVDELGASRLHVFASGTSGGRQSITLATSEADRLDFRGVLDYAPDSLNNNLGSGVVVEDTPVFTYYNMTPPERRLWAVRVDHGGTSRRLIAADILPVGFPTLAADHSSGPRADRIYSVWVEGPDQRKLDVVSAHSDDLGHQWSDRVVVNSNADSVLRSLPFVAVNRYGVVGVSWHDRRRDTRGDCGDVYWAASLDGGVTFSREVRVSSETACLGTTANGAAARRWRLGGGDYQGMAASADGSFHVIWADSRTGVFQIWVARLSAE